MSNWKAAAGPWPKQDGFCNSACPGHHIDRKTHVGGACSADAVCAGQYAYEIAYCKEGCLGHKYIPSESGVTRVGFCCLFSNCHQPATDSSRTRCKYHGFRGVMHDSCGRVIYDGRGGH